MYYLAVILYCSVPTEIATCDVLIRKDHLFQTEEACKEEMMPIAEGLFVTGHYVKAKCYKFNPYGEEA